MGPCPYLCVNKNAFGYCLYTGCVGPVWNRSFMVVENETGVAYTDRTDYKSKGDLRMVVINEGEVKLWIS